MCQQWFSIFGQIFDVLGFLLIAFEWRRGFLGEREGRINQLQYDFDRTQAERSWEGYKDPRAADHTMWREVQKLFIKEWRMRGRIFYGGVVLVVLGFLFQVMGSWPGGVFGVRSC
jgi:hypothetical protein